MRYGIPYLLAVACSACLICAALAAGSFARSAMATERCVEAAPCWDWATMGNHKRGVYVEHIERHELSDGHVWYEHIAAKRVVGPCRFQRLARKHRLAWWVGSDVMPHLRGDRFARKHGCNAGI